MTKTIYPIISDDPAVQAFYENSRRDGNSHNIAEMCALRSAPRGMTDNVFFEGVGTLAKQFEGDERVLEKVTKTAMAHGYKPNPNDFYNSSLAAFVGDPKAFIPASGGRGHVQAVCEERGWSCQGAVKVKGRDRKPVKQIRLGKDIVARTVQETIAADPSKARIDKRDLAAEVIRKHGAKKQ
jgi:hypothetical protein